MIKVMKHGRPENKRSYCTRHECECGCVFTFGVEDTEVIQIDYNETKRTIKCPDCGRRIYIE